jgi:hypothetical protein
VAGQPPDVSDILAAVRERRIGAATAAAWLELRLAAHSREVRAHATQQMRDRLHSALDSALSGGSADEFTRLFPPEKPLGPDLGHQEYRPAPPVYPGEGQGRRSRPVTSWDGYTQASAGEMSDEELYSLLFGRPDD